MAEITANAVKELREKTGLPMMDCKKALAEAGGDQSKAIDWLRKQNIKLKETRLGRETSAGRIAVYSDMAKGVAAMVEVKCESAPVANGPDFKNFAADLAKQLATGPGAKTAEELLAQPALNFKGTLGEQKDDMFNRIREVFNVGRIARINGTVGAYAHHDGTIAALVEVKGGTPELAKDVAMHVAANNPAAVSKESLDPAAIDKEREILAAAARAEGKPENIITKMIEGRLKNFFAERVLLEQPFIKDEAMTVGQLAKKGNMEVVSIVRWQLGKE